LLQPTDRYISGHLNSAIATQSFAVSYADLATAITANDAAGIAAAVGALTSANGMLLAAGTELQSAWANLRLSDLVIGLAVGHSRWLAMTGRRAAASGSVVRT